MVVRWTGVKSSTSLSTTNVAKLLAVRYREERRERGEKGGRASQRVAEDDGAHPIQ